MSTAIASAPAPAPKIVEPANVFRRQSTAIATSLLRDWVGEERANEAVGRIAAALSAAAASAKDPKEFYACTPASIGTCIAVAALTGIMPGTGSTALAYVVPQRPRKDDPPQLQYSLSHRGLNALARRCGQTMIAIPVSYTDEIRSGAYGSVELVSQDIDNPPVKFDDLRGVIVIVKEIRGNAITYCGWMPKKLIEQRRAMSRSFSGKSPQYSPWSTWPVEMSMKAAMHYAISRGWCVIDDTNSTRAMGVEVESDLRRLDAPTGPTTVNEVADLIGGNGHQSHDLAESLRHRIEDVQTPDEFAELSREIDAARNAGVLSASSAGELMDALKDRETVLMATAVTVSTAPATDLAPFSGGGSSETAPVWERRVMHAITATTSHAELDQIRHVIDAQLQAKFMSSDRHGKLVQAIDAQSDTFSEQ